MDTDASMNRHPVLQRVLVAATIVAPVLLLGSTLVAVAAGTYNESTAQGVLEMFSFGAFFLVIAGTTTMLAEALPRVSAVLLVTGTLGCQAGVAFGVVAIARDKGLDMPDGPLAVAFNAPALLFPLTWIAVGLCLVVKRLGPAWVGAVLVLAGLGFPVARAGGVAGAAVVDDLLFVVGLVGLALASRRVGVGAPESARRG